MGTSCRSIISDATQAGIALPLPYDQRGADALLTDLAEPNQLGDDVLDWLIDLPAGARTAPEGSASTTPPTPRYA